MTVKRTQRGSSHWLTIANSETRNALTTKDRFEIAEGLREADRDESTAVVVITGEGDNFCSGGDIREFGFERTTLAASRYAADIAQVVFRALRDIQTPTVARVMGTAAGAGMYLALGCDIVVATKDTSFLPAHLELAVPPDWGALWILPRLVGMARAKQHVLTGRPISATTANEWGLIAEAVSSEDLDATVDGYCADISRYLPSVVAAARKGLDLSLDTSLSSFLEWEAASISASIQTPEHRDRVAQFLMKTGEAEQ